MRHQDPGTALVEGIRLGLAATSAGHAKPGSAGGPGPGAGPAVLGDYARGDAPARPGSPIDEHRPPDVAQPEHQSAVFTIDRNDADYERSRSARYRRPHRGVRVIASRAVDLGLRCDAALAIAPAGSAVSGRSAAILYSLPLPRAIERDPRPQLMAPVVNGGSTLDLGGAQCRLCLLPDTHVQQWQGRAVTTPARTFLDLAAVLDLPDLVAVGDSILRRELATLEQLTAVIDWAVRRRGVAVARRALTLLDPRAESPPESRVRVLLALAGLPAPEPNGLITDELGEFLARGDLVWRTRQVVVEYDGRVHNSEERRRADAVRRNLLVREGWTVLVYTSDVLARWPERNSGRRTSRPRSLRPFRVDQGIGGALEGKTRPSTPTYSLINECERERGRTSALGRGCRTN